MYNAYFQTRNCQIRVDTYMEVTTEAIVEVIDELINMFFDGQSAVDVIDERTTILDKLQPSVDTTLEVKQESLFEVMYENNTILDKEQPSVDKKVQTHLCGLYSTHNGGLLYYCDNCQYKAKRRCDIKTHTPSQHKGIRYSCDQCDYTSSQRGHINRHVREEHEGVHYPCYQCDYKSKYKGNLKRHVQAKHERYIYQHTA